MVGAVLVPQAQALPHLLTKARLEGGTLVGDTLRCQVLQLPGGL